MDKGLLSNSDVLPSDDGASNVVVQKFGGTSVGKCALSIINQVVIPSLSEHRVVVVCSARSGSIKAEGTTNHLLRAAREAENGQSPHYASIVETVRLEHIQVAENEIQSEELKSRLVNDIDGECERIVKVLEAVQTPGKMSSHCVDKVISTGEKLSCRLMAAFLQDRGVDSRYLDLAEIIDFPIPGEVIDQEFYDHLASAFGRKIRECQGEVSVVTGYFGAMPGGLLDQIGRGYTDLCAALVAIGIHAKELQVWKEVDGIFTADPQKVPTAQLLPAITASKAAELTLYGSEVIHPFTMEQVIRAKLPIRVKNVMNPKGGGTVIFPDSSYEVEKTVPGKSPTETL